MPGEVAAMSLHLMHTERSPLCLQNRALNLQLEKERHKVAKLQQSLSQASQTQQAAAPVSRKALLILCHSQLCVGQHTSTEGLLVPVLSMLIRPRCSCASIHAAFGSLNSCAAMIPGQQTHAARCGQPRPDCLPLLLCCRIQKQPQQPRSTYRRWRP